MLNLIREVNKDDFDKIREIGNHYNNHFKDTYDLDNSINKVYGYEDKGVIKGFVLINEFSDNIDLLMIIVKEEEQTKGIGSLLMDYLMKIKVKKTITLEVNVNNDKAIHLYQKYNFEIVNIRKRYYGKDDAYVMVVK